MKTPSLTDFEKRIAKRLSSDGERNQDIHLLINIGRTPTVNFGRLSGCSDWDIEPATDDEVDRYRFEKSLVDLKTGLLPIENERLFRSREAMKSAVQTFNSTTVLFKSEIFAVLSQIAWTYLLHEFYDRQGVQIENEQGNTLLLGQMVDRPDCPLAPDVIKNLKAIKVLRDSVEHKTLHSLGRNFWPLFQANCLNYDQAIRALFDERAGLRDELSISLQFANLDIQEISKIQKYDVNPEIEAINEIISELSGEDGTESESYRFKVNFSFEKATKGDSHIVFSKNNPNASSTHTIMEKKVVSDEVWPHKPSRVVSIVNERTGKAFNSHLHTLAWKKFGARPRTNSKTPHDTNKKYCSYHAAHKDYTYSESWVDLLVEQVVDDEKLTALKSFKPKDG